MTSAQLGRPRVSDARSPSVSPRGSASRAHERCNVSSLEMFAGAEITAAIICRPSTVAPMSSTLTRGLAAASAAMYSRVWA